MLPLKKQPGVVPRLLHVDAAAYYSHLRQFEMVCRAVLPVLRAKTQGCDIFAMTSAGACLAEAVHIMARAGRA